MLIAFCLYLFCVVTQGQRGTEVSLEKQVSQALQVHRVPQGRGPLLSESVVMFLPFTVKASRPFHPPNPSPQSKSELKHCTYTKKVDLGHMVEFSPKRPVVETIRKSPFLCMVWNDAKTIGHLLQLIRPCFAILAHPYLICYVHPVLFTTIVSGRRWVPGQVDFYVRKMAFKKRHRWKHLDQSMLQLFLSIMSKMHLKLWAARCSTCNGKCWFLCREWLG